MIAEDFDQPTRVSMELALERACKCLPHELNHYEGRKVIAAGILACAAAGHTHLDDLCEAADLTAAQWVNEQGTNALKRA